MQDITPLPIARADGGPDKGYGSVPVKKPVGSVSLTQQVDNPISTDARTLAQFASEAEMDKILDDINKKVQAGKTEESSKKGFFSFLKRSEKKPNPPPIAHQPVEKTENSKQPAVASKKRRFVPAAAVAVIVSIALCAFAFTAFAKKDTPQTSDNQSQQSSDSSQSNTSVASEDVDKLSSDIKSQTESLSSEEDWSSEDLSDSALGL